jgi:hypothetical protein
MDVSASYDAADQLYWALHELNPSFQLNAQSADGALLVLEFAHKKMWQAVAWCFLRAGVSPLQPTRSSRFNELPLIVALVLSLTESDTLPPSSLLHILRHLPSNMSLQSVVISPSHEGTAITLSTLLWQLPPTPALAWFGCFLRAGFAITQRDYDALMKLAFSQGSREFGVSLRKCIPPPSSSSAVELALVTTPPLPSIDAIHVIPDTH